MRPIKVCSTLAMRIHSACQFFSALKYLNLTQNQTDDVISRGVVDLISKGTEGTNIMAVQDYCRRRLGEFNFIAWEEKLKELLKRELQVPGESMTMRAISTRAFPLHEVEKEIVPLLYNSRRVRIQNSSSYKDLGRVSEALMFKKLHWNAQFHTPHGRLVRVENYTLRRSRPGESFSCWKDAIKEVCVVSVQPNVATDMYPYVTRGESYDHVELSDDLPYNSEREIRENEVRVGRVIVKTTWLGFSYCNPHRPSQALRNIRTSIHNTTRAKIQEVLNYADWNVPIRVLQNDPNADERTKNLEFFKPAESSKNGWRWNISSTVEFPLKSQEKNTRESVLRMLCAELRLRLSGKLNCSPRQITICLSSRSLLKCITAEEKKIEDGNTSKSSLKSQDHNAWSEDTRAKFILYESSSAGVAIECLRLLLPQSGGSEILSPTMQLQLSDLNRRRELWDFKIMKEWEDNARVPELIIDCLRWLDQSARAENEPLTYQPHTYEPLTN